jgi:hypothetical protein
MANITILADEEPIENADEKSYDYMDYFFKFYSISETFTIEDAFEKSDLPEDKKKEANRLEKQVRELLTDDYEYAKLAAKYPYPLKLTSKGKEAKRKGGHFAYESYLKELNMKAI